MAGFRLKMATLEQRAQAPTYEQRSRHGASEIFDLDVKALKSCSRPGGI